MEVELITKGDLEAFKIKLIEEIKALMSDVHKTNMRPWLKGNEVRKLLGISAGSLQNLRVSGKLKSSKIGGIHYYRHEDVERLFNS